MERRKWKSSFRRFLRSAAAVVLAACMLPVPVQAAGSTSSDNGDGTFTNPVIYSDVPDLDVIRVEDNYYMVSTTMHLSPGMPIMKSKDLVNWEIVNYCYDILDDSDELSSETEKKHMETEHGPQASSIMTANSMYLHPARQLRKPMYSQPQTLKTVCGRNRFWTVIITTCPFFLTIRRTGLTFICLQAPVLCM